MIDKIWIVMDALLTEANVLRARYLACAISAACSGSIAYAMAGRNLSY